MLFLLADFTGWLNKIFSGLLQRNEWYDRRKPTKNFLFGKIDQNLRKNVFRWEITIKFTANYSKKKVNILHISAKLVDGELITFIC